MYFKNHIDIPNAANHLHEALTTLYTKETGSFILLCNIAPGQNVDQFLIVHNIQTMEKIVRLIPAWLGVRRARNSGTVSQKFP